MGCGSDASGDAGFAESAIGKLAVAGAELLRTPESIINDTTNTIEAASATGALTRIQNASDLMRGERFSMAPVIDVTLSELACANTN
jgi:hypothetical protein